MRHLHTFQLFIQDLYEARKPVPYESIIIMGLPGSGKSSLAKEIQSRSPEKRFVIYDDFESQKALPKMGSENQIISDTMLTLDPPEGGLEDFEEVAEFKGSKLQIIYFENDPESAQKNITTRWQSGQAQKHQRPGMLNPFWMSKRYKVPPGAKTIPVFRSKAD
jgi:hypothetical protein